MNPLVSIIIPSYNAEKYLKRCIESIISQTMKDFEVLIINDGSRDGTGTIADDYASRDSRFRAFHQENQGVATARQVGLDNARGIFTIHMDADDWVDSDMLKELVSFAELKRADVVICDYYEIDGSTIRYNCQKPYPDDRLSIWGQSFNSLSGSLCNKLIRRDCYSQYGITFEKGVNYEEDKLICLKLLSHNISVHYLNRAFYHYDHTQNPQSLSISEFQPQKRLDILKRVESYCDISPVQQYFDNAIFYIAYQALALPKTTCPDFRSLFIDYLDSIKRATGFPWYTKRIVLLRLYGIHIITPNRIRFLIHKLIHQFHR